MTIRKDGVRRSVVVLGFVLVGTVASHAQIAVFDAAVTARNSVTAALKEYLLTVQTEQHSELRRMAHRLSMFTNLGKYTVPDPPRWRTHAWGWNDPFLFAPDYVAALTYGDAAGVGYTNTAQMRADATTALSRLTPSARRTLTSALATLDLADATVIAATHDTGQLRYNGRAELRAIEALDQDVTNGSLEQSTTAVLDKISGAVLIGARQRQARVQLLNGVVEQLLVEGKRARDTEAATMNMQLVAWRDRQAVNTAFVAGSGDALRTWRQP
jgi:hypothetical protein